MPGGHRALEKVNFHIKPGELAFLTGHSGAGKSTLLKLISLMERPSAGNVFINGVDLNKVKFASNPVCSPRHWYYFSKPSIIRAIHGI